MVARSRYGTLTNGNLLFWASLPGGRLIMRSTTATRIVLGTSEKKAELSLMAGRGGAGFMAETVEGESVWALLGHTGKARVSATGGEMPQLSVSNSSGSTRAVLGATLTHSGHPTREAGVSCDEANLSFVRDRSVVARYPTLDDQKKTK